MKNRFLAILLTLTLVFSMTPITTFAAGADTNVAKIGEVGYGTLEEAFAAAKDGDTVILSSTYSSENDLSAIAKLNGKKVTVQGGGMNTTCLKVVYDKQDQHITNCSTITFKELDITFVHKTGMPYTETLSANYDTVKINGLLSVYAGKSVLKNCVFTGPQNKDIDVYLFWQYTGEAELDNCTFEKPAPKGAVKIYAESGYHADMTVKNCTFKDLTGTSYGCGIYASNKNNIDKPIYNLYVSGNTVPNGFVEYKPSGNGITAVNPTFEDGKYKSATFITANTDDTVVKNAIEAAAVESFVAEKNADGTYGLEEAASTAVAKIGDTGYENFNDAVNAAKAATSTEGKTITIVGTVDEAYAFAGDYSGITFLGSETGKVTAGWTVQGNDTNMSNITIDGVKFCEGGNIVFSTAAANYSGMKIQNCTFIGTGADSTPAIQIATGTAPFDGIKIYNNTISGFNGTSSNAILFNIDNGHTDSGTVTIEKNTVTDFGHNGIQFVLAKADLVIKDNVFTCTKTDKDVLNLNSGKSVTLTGNTFTVPADYSTGNQIVWNNNAGVMIDATGNTFKKGEATLTDIKDLAAHIAGYANNKTFVGYGLAKDANSKLNAGYLCSYNEATVFPTDLIAEGYEPVFVEKYGSVNVYQIQKKTAEPVAKIGDTEYETLDAALEAANENDIITILADSIEMPYISKQNITIQGQVNDEGTPVTEVTSWAWSSEGSYKKNVGVTFKNLLMKTGVTFYGNNTTFYNCTFNGNSGASIYGDGIATIDHCLINPTGQYGIKYDSESATGGGISEVIVKDSKIKGTVAISGDPKNISFTNCKFAGRSPSGHCNINIYKLATFTNCSFTQDYTTGSSRGILMYDEQKKSSVSVSMNGCSAAEGDGTLYDVIRQDYYAQGVTAFDATVDENGKFTAGTFIGNLDTLNSRIAEGYEVEVVNETKHIYSLKEVAGSVAKIGDTEYATLAEAVAAASDGCTIDLLANIELTETVSVAKQITLDLGTFSITPAAGGLTANSRGTKDALIAVNYGGDLTITGTTGMISSNNIASVYAAVKMTEKGEIAGEEPARLTVNSGTLEGYYYGITGNGNRHNTEIIINGGVIKGTATDDSAGIFNPQDGSLAVNGGTIEGASGIYVKAGTVTVFTGGTIKGVGSEKAFVHSGSGFNPTGAAFVVENCGYPGGTPNVAISGSTFLATNGDAVESYGYDSYPELTGFITGGFFSSDVQRSLVATGHKTCKVADKLWTVGVDDQTQKADTTKDIAEVVTVKEGTTGITETEAQTKVQNTINNNTAVNSFVNSDIKAATTSNASSGSSNLKKVIEALEAAATDETAKTAINSLSTDTELSSYIKVKTETATVANFTVNSATTVTGTTVTSMTFDVKPYAEITVKNGENVEETVTAVIPNNAITSPITFRLPVATEVPTGTVVKVYHSETAVTDQNKGGFFGNYKVLEEDGKKFIELASGNFSYFTYELTKDIIGSASFSKTLMLRGKIGINFNVKNITAEPSHYYVKWTFMGQEQVANVSSFTKADGENKYSKVLVEAAAAEMTKNLHITVFYTPDANKTTHGIQIYECDYSVRQYAVNAIDNSNDENLKSLCRSMLDYGAFAQQYFNVDTDNLANAGGYGSGTDFTTVSVPQPTYVSSTTGTVTGIEKVSKTLSLQAATTVNFLIKLNEGANISDYTFKYRIGSNAEVTATATQQADGRYRVCAENIASAELGWKTEFTIVKGTETMTITYNPMAYAYSVGQNSTDNVLKNVCKALYEYNNKAKTYFSVTD